MRDAGLRKHRVATLAILNLSFWVALACLVGLLLGDKVDLGVETLLRQAQATVVVAWEQRADPAWPVAQVPDGAGLPVSTLDTPQAGAADSVEPSPWPGLASPSPTLAPVMPVAPTPGYGVNPSGQLFGPVPTASPSTGASSGSPLSGTLTATATSPAASGDNSALSPGAPRVASPGQPLRTAPLLLADPTFGDLSLLNAEMERSVSGRPVQIRYQEAALNLEIAGLLTNDPTLPYRDVTFDLQRDHVVVTGKVSVLGFQVNAAVEGTILARDCQPMFEIESVSVASVVTPNFVKAQVAEMLQEAMAWYPAGYPLCIEQIVLEEANASIYGVRR